MVVGAGAHATLVRCWVAGSRSFMLCSQQNALHVRTKSRVFLVSIVLKVVTAHTFTVHITAWIKCLKAHQDYCQKLPQQTRIRASNKTVLAVLRWLWWQGNHSFSPRGDKKYFLWRLDPYRKYFCVLVPRA